MRIRRGNHIWDINTHLPTLSTKYYIPSALLSSVLWYALGPLRVNGDTILAGKWTLLITSHYAIRQHVYWGSLFRAIVWRNKLHKLLVRHVTLLFSFCIDAALVFLSVTTKAEDNKEIWHWTVLALGQMHVQTSLQHRLISRWQLYSQ